MRKTVSLVGAGVGVAGVALLAATVIGAPQPPPHRYELNDSHLHLTNYIQEGVDIRTVLRLMGTRVGRSALFGIPLQQEWSFRVDGNDAPTYYLDSDSELYYYSFTDAVIAMAYKSLSPEQQKRFDPMITGFDPSDMYAADHVRRVLELFPDTFVGIGEFSLHKEFVTSKIAGGPPSIEDPALDRLLDFAGEVGLVVLVHCDIDTPFPKPGAAPAYLAPMTQLFLRHPNTTFIWAHIGLGRVVRPVKDQATYIEAILANPRLKNVNFDISWTETAKYLDQTPQTVEIVADIMTRYPDRFLFGSDDVAPTNEKDYLAVYNMYQPLWNKLPPDVATAVKKTNYDRLFDDARRKVRYWQDEQRNRVRVLGRR